MPAGVPASIRVIRSFCAAVIIAAAHSPLFDIRTFVRLSHDSARRQTSESGADAGAGLSRRARERRMARLRTAGVASDSAGAARGDYLEGLARGLAVMAAFDGERRRMTLSDVARATALPRASARRALLTLQALGYVESEGRQFRLTPKVLTL